jgi:alpha-galactosidase
MNYHDIDGNPLVDLNRFPDLKQMTDYAHNLNLTAGWYGNNCICRDHCGNETECDLQIKGDVAALTKFNFDSWKLDGCGGEWNLLKFNKYIQEASEKPILVENCHWEIVPPFRPVPDVPPAEGCPWNFYRTSQDVRASFASVMHNLHTTIHLAENNLSYPGCWAYPGA